MSQPTLTPAPCQVYQGRLNDGMQLNQVKELLDARRRLLWREQRRAPGSHGRRAVVAHARPVFVTGTRTGRHIKPRRIKLAIRFELEERDGGNTQTTSDAVSMAMRVGGRW